jgi:DNA repair/transcription protein MET18/MMS19
VRPKELIAMQHFRLFLKALELPITDLRRNILETFAVLITDAPTSIADHSALLIAALLDLAAPSDPAQSSADERVAALRCLAAFPGAVDYLHIANQRGSVLKRLARCLDDRKRAVRREAVDCRSAWFLLEAK